MVVLGAGGAATAIQVQCALDGAESISIFNPKDPFFARAESTAEKLSKETPDCKVSVFDLADEAKLKEEVANADILVNATLAGMKPHEELTLIKDKSMFRPDLVVADVVYNPAETRMEKKPKKQVPQACNRRKRNAVMAGSCSLQTLHRTGNANS